MLQHANKSSLWHRICCTGTAQAGAGWRQQNMYSSLLPCKQLTKNTELLTLINNCSAACSCNNCSNSTEEGSVFGNDDMPMDDDIDEQEYYSIMKYFHFSVFQDMCCMILCSNGVLDASCHKHTFFCDSLSHFLCSITQGLGFGNFFGFACFFL